MARQRAIVIGGSMSGMLAPRVLADHFAEVVLFDRDAFPKPGENRKGVPQGQHAHALLSSGRELDPPPSLMQPSMAFRILSGNMRRPPARH